MPVRYSRSDEGGTNIASIPGSVIGSPSFCATCGQLALGDVLAHPGTSRVVGVAQEAGRLAVASERVQGRVLDRAAVEGVGAARVEAAAARRLRRVGHLARQRERQAPAPSACGIAEISASV